MCAVISSIKPSFEHISTVSANIAKVVKRLWPGGPLALWLKEFFCTAACSITLDSNAFFYYTDALLCKRVGEAY